MKKLSLLVPGAIALGFLSFPARSLAQFPPDFQSGMVNGIAVTQTNSWIEVMNVMGEVSLDNGVTFHDVRVDGIYVIAFGNMLNATGPVQNGWSFFYGEFGGDSSSGWTAPQGTGLEHGSPNMHYEWFSIDNHPRVTGFKFTSPDPIFGGGNTGFVMDAVPEPSTLIALAGLVALVGFRKRLVRP